MISLTHLVFGLALAYILDMRLVTAIVFSIVPDFDITFNFLYPFVHRGIMHTLIAGAVFSLLVYLYSEDLDSSKSCLLGYISHLLLDLLTFSGVPVFFPLYRDFALGLSSAYSLKWNSSIIAISLIAMYSKKNSGLVKEFLSFQ